MASKVNATGFRVGINKNWTSRWCALNKEQYVEWIVADEKIRNFFTSRKFADGKVVRCEIERQNKNINIFVYCCNIGYMTSAEVDKNTKLLVQKIVGKKYNVKITYIDYGNQYWSAKLVADEIAHRIEMKEPFRTVQKSIITQVMRNGVLGIKTLVSGRLNGVDMARTEGYTKGIISLTTIRADIDYACVQSFTKMGIIGIKVWLNKGQIFKSGLNNQIPVKSSATVLQEDQQRRNFKGKKGYKN